MKETTGKRNCMECGQSFRSSDMLKVGRKMYCKECSQEILTEKRDTKSNPNINIVNQQTVSNPEYSNGKQIVTRNYVVGLVLSIFLGWFGIDRFYVNHIGLGILKLLTGGGFGIWWFIDIIMFATKNVRYVRWK